MPQLIPRTDSGWEGFPSIGYMVKLYQGNPNSGGTEISTTIEQSGAIVGWWMNFGAGAIKVASSFTAITDPTDVWIEGFRYIGKEGGASGDIDANISLFNCLSSSAVGDIVRLSDSVNNTVVSETNNQNISPSIGIIIEKISTTTCRVVLFGKCVVVYTGLTVDKKVFIGTDGKPTSTVPNTGYIQIIGLCFETNKVHISPSCSRIKRNPF